MFCLSSSGIRCHIFDVKCEVSVLESTAAIPRMEGKYSWSQILLADITFGTSEWDSAGIYSGLGLSGDGCCV